MSCAEYCRCVRGHGGEGEGYQLTREAEGERVNQQMKVSKKVREEW
jgi:hypothetical protein